MTTILHRTAPVLAILLLAGGCASTDDGGAGTAQWAAPADNTAEICKSGGEAARTVVVDLLGKMAQASDEAEMVKVYQTTFGTLRDDLTSAAGKATDPQLAAALNGIAAEADKIAATTDPETVETAGFEKALGKLEGFCPSDGGSKAPAGAAGGTVGAKGSACELPVTFTAADKWKVTAVDSGGELAELTRKGPLQMTCEIAAKPAGVTAFLRVWTDTRAAGDARAALKALTTGAKTRNADYSPVQLGGRDGMELGYEEYSELMEEYSKRRAFAVPAGDGAVVVELSGLESDDPAAQAAYEQAKSTLEVTS